MSAVLTLIGNTILPESNKFLPQTTVAHLRLGHSTIDKSLNVDDRFGMFIVASEAVGGYDYAAWEDIRAGPSGKLVLELFKTIWENKDATFTDFRRLCECSTCAITGVYHAHPPPLAIFHPDVVGLCI